MDEATIGAAPGNRDGVCILKVDGPFTLKNVMDFQLAFRDCNHPVTIVDLSDVPYLDSAALGALISVHTSSQQHDRKYALTGVADRLKTLMQMTGVADLLVMYPTNAEAEQKLLN
jgi:anti-anti-sigma factor